MTDQDQLIEIAALDGWLEVKEYTFNYDYMGESGEYKQVRGFNPEDLGNLRCLRDYLNSRDVIVPVIEKQPYEIKCQIGVELAKMDGWKHANLDEVSNFDWDDIILLVTKPARQLSEALLRSVGRWKD